MGPRGPRRVAARCNQDQRGFEKEVAGSPELGTHVIGELGWEAIDD